MADEQNVANESAAAPQSAAQQGGDAATTGDNKKSWYERIGANMPPGDSYVTSGGITITAAFLILLISILLWRIIVLWPVCELPEGNANVAATSVEANRNSSPAANTNSPAATGANTGTAATNVNANAAANINTNARANTNVNTVALANANANANARAPSTGPSPATTTGNATPAKLDADSIEPTSGSITGKTLVTIKGKNFGATPKGLTVKFGEVEGKVSKISDTSISVATPMHSEGVVDVTVERDGDSDVLLSAYTYTCPAPTGSNLFLMLVMAGALGGCIHALRSFFWYTGQRELKWSWLPMYYTLPFVGAAMAMIFSLLIFAGFVDNTTGRSQSLFIIAVAGLVGMFSQQAALKLTDVANAFFTKPGQGSDARPQKSLSVGETDTKATPIRVTGIDKKTGKAGDAVKISGSGFNTSTRVTFGGKPARVKEFDSTSITVEAPQGTGEVVIEVKSGDQTTQVPDKFTYQ